MDNEREIVNIDEEFSDGMIERIDYLENATVEYLSKISEQPLDPTVDLGVTEIVGDVLELACNMLNLRGYYGCYPYRDEDNSPIVLLCTHCDECPVLEMGNCKYKEEPYVKNVEYKDELEEE